MNPAVRCALLGALLLAAMELVGSPIGPQSSAPTDTVTSWTAEEGLPENTVLAIAQTPEGYFWIGTRNGIARFDGVRFVPFRLRDGLKTLLTPCLLADNQSRLWVGTLDNGVMVRENGNFRFYSKTNGLPEGAVRNLTQDSDGHVWAAMERGLARWNGARCEAVAPPQLGTNRAGWNWVAAAGKKVWAVKDGYEVWQWQQEKWELLPPLKTSGFRFDRVFGTRGGALWAQLLPYGLARLEDGNWRVFDAAAGLPESYIWSVLERADGSLLCGSYERGLFQFRDGVAQPAGLNHSPQMDGVLALHEDGRGNLWAGTRSHGLLRLRPSRVQTLAGTEEVRIARVAIEARGRTWVGGNPGLWFERDGQFQQVAGPEAVRKQAVLALLPCSSGGVWFSLLNEGLWRFDPERMAEAAQIFDSVENQKWVHALAEDGTGGLWFGTGGGLAGHLVGGQVQLFKPLGPGIHNRVVGLVAEPSGGVWLGSEGDGVRRLDAHGQVTLSLTAKDGLPINAVRCLLGASDGGLWIGTAEGLCHWNKSRLTILDSRNGLPDETISSLALDRASNLWCAANSRLFRIDHEELRAVTDGKTHVVRPLLLRPSDGLDPITFVTGIAPNAVVGQDGHLFFPRTEGILTLDPKRFEEPPKGLHAVIEEAWINGKETKLPVTGDGRVQVPAGSSQLELRYTALGSAAAETVRFRYRFEGLDKAWTEAGEERTARFLRLRPGPYRFQVAAAEGAGAWAEPGASLLLVIEPTFWQTIWFRVLLGAAGAVVAAALYWRRVRQFEMKRAVQEAFSRQLLQHQEAERKRIAAELHDSLEQNLLVIRNRALLALSESEVPTALKESLDEISLASSDSIEEVRTIANNLRPHQLKHLGLSRALTGLLRSVAQSSRLRLTTEISEVKGMLSEENEIHLYRIVQESLNNVLKHAAATEASVSLRCQAHGLALQVRDNGRGFDAAGAMASAGDGAGFGLSGIAERARMLGGHLKVMSSPGAGTLLEVEIPKSKIQNPGSHDA